MGCISSKVISKSLSYREENRQSLERTAKPIPFLKDLLSSRKGSDRCLTLVCAADVIANKLRSGSLSSNVATTKLAVEPACIENVTGKREIVLETPEQGEDKQMDIELDKQDKSNNLLPQHSATFLDQKTSYVVHLGVVRSRSFHTVEEYDALVEKLWSSKPPMVQQIRSKSKDDTPGIDVHVLDSESLSEAYDHTEEENYVLEEEEKGSSPNICSRKETSQSEDTDNSGSASEIKESTEIPYSHSSNNGSGLESSVSESVAHGGNFVEKGFKRKTLAKRLNSLTIPSDIEYPPIASLREWLPPVSHVAPTPRLGTEIENDSTDTVFSTETVDALEQCMQQLEAEEGSLLKVLVHNIEENKAVEYKKVTSPVV